MLHLPAPSFTEAGGYHGDLHLFLHGVVLNRAENNVGILVGGLLDNRGRLVDLVQGKARRAADVDENALRPLNGVVFEQRATDRAVGGVHRAIGARSHGGTHHSVALSLHNRFHVGEVAVDDAGDGDDVADPLHGLAQDVVGDAEGLEDNSIQGAQGILINVSGSSSLTLHEVHEASSIIQKAAHENANIIFGAVQDDAMKEQVKITVIAAGFRETGRRRVQHRPSYMPKTWKAAREERTVVEQVAHNVGEALHEVPLDDLDVPTFLRRQAQKA